MPATEVFQAPEVDGGMIVRNSDFWSLGCVVSDVDITKGHSGRSLTHSIHMKIVYALTGDLLFNSIEEKRYYLGTPTSSFCSYFILPANLPSTNYRKGCSVA